MDFRPLPFLGNPHVQTILASLWAGAPVSLPTTLHVVPLPDGDALAAHDTMPLTWQPGDPVAVLVHGLGGSHASPHMQRLVNRFAAANVRAVRVDLRGAGAGVHLASRVYNAACADDVRIVAEFILRQTPTSPLALVGFSLGGNIVLNVVGQAKRRPLDALRAVATLSPPVDLVLCSEMLSRIPFYDHYYARNLRSQVAEHERRVPRPTASRFPRPLTLRRFDDLYTAPRGGFADALDYYRRASSLPVIPDAAVPTLILTARDDPFIAAAPIEKLRGHGNLQIQVVAHGGHLGFLGGDGAGGLRWAERRVVEWVLEALQA